MQENKENIPLVSQLMLQYGISYQFYHELSSIIKELPQRYILYKNYSYVHNVTGFWKMVPNPTIIPSCYMNRVAVTNSKVFCNFAWNLMIKVLAKLI